MSGAATSDGEARPNEVTEVSQTAAAGQLRALIERIERLEEEKRALADDIREKFKEAKALGFDAKIMKKVIAARKKSRDARLEEEALLDTYMHALGMAAETV